METITKNQLSGAFSSFDSSFKTIFGSVREKEKARIVIAKELGLTRNVKDPAEQK
jgi:hypothetical protein